MRTEHTMNPEALVQLVSTGNTQAVEEAWMGLMESSDAAPAQLAAYDCVLRELSRQDRKSQAEELAWSAIESLAARFEPIETLRAAGPFLLAVGEGDELRAQVVALYRSSHADVEGLETLLSESGLGGGRPVRRALRTLDVCLNLTVGDYLSSRDGDGAAQVEAIDTNSWNLTITNGSAPETVDAVRLADRYRPAAPSEFGVMRQFAREQLDALLKRDPAQVVVEICRAHDHSIDTNALEHVLVPDLIAPEDWKKWWSKARTALKRVATVKIEGRNPSIIRYDETPVALEEELWVSFERQRDAIKRLALVEQYSKDCKARGEMPSSATLERCFGEVSNRARRLAAKDPPGAALLWVIAIRIGRAAGHDGIADDAMAFLRRADDLEALFRQIQDDALVEEACDWVQAALPDDWAQRLTELLPTFPLAACDRTTQRLVTAGFGSEHFEPVIQAILASPIRHFEALLWLWDGPSASQTMPAPALTTLFSRILRTLDDCRRSERVAKETTRKIAARARTVLTARKFERFDQCLEALDPAMAAPLRVQLRRQELLGRAAREDMVRRLDRKFPPISKQKQIPPWELEDVLFVTEPGLVKKQDEIEHHVNVKMKENAKAIGRAAEHGDLSENSEYKFALEERDLLRARLAQMNAEVAAARVISPGDVPTDHIGIGTRAVFQRDSDGERYVMSFVGPWEADGRAGLFNYLAPLSKSLMGKRIGDMVEFDHSGASGAYKVVALENALESMVASRAPRADGP